MSQRVVCPSCGRELVVAGPASGAPVTCPRCLAEVAVPQAVRAEPPERREAGLSCPQCGRSVEAIWIACPWCEEPLRGRDPGRYGRPDLDVRRDSRRTRTGVVVLAVIGCLGVGLLAVQAFAMFTQYQAIEPMLALAVGVLFLAGIATLIVFLRSGGNPGADGFRRVVVGTLALVGGLMTCGVLAGMALFVFLLVVCFSGGFKGL